MEVALFNSDGSAFESDMLEVAAGGTDSLLFSDPEGEVRNGWARLTSDQPFNAAIFFRIAGSGNVGVLPSEQGVKFKLFTFVGDGTDTGFAVANPSETEESTVTAKIYSAAGELQREVQETYGPGEHEALFVTQEPLLVEGDSLIEFTATQPVILLGLRTDNNLLSSTAVIRPQGTGIDPGSITTEHLANGAVTGEKIAAGAVVRSLNGLTDNLTIAAGDNVTLTPNGQTLTIAATGGGGGGGDITAVNVGDGLAGGGPTGAVSVSLAPDGVTSTHLADASVGLSELAAEVSFGRVEGSNIILGDISNSVTGDSSTVAGVLSCEGCTVLSVI